MPHSVAVAVVRGDVPEVFVAEDLETLNWVIALRVIAATLPEEVDPGTRTRLCEALLNERWGEAVALWIERVDPDGIDVYESHDLYVGRDVEVAADEMQFRPLFRS